MNVSRYFLPHVLALSTSSPFWMGRQTGLKSYRSVIFRNFPRTGTPPIMNAWTDYAALLHSLVRTGCVPDGSQDLVGRPAESVVSDARVPHLRRLHARRRGRLHRGHPAGHHREALEAPARQPDVPRLSVDRHRGEQVARRPLRPRGQAGRLRQGRGAAGRRTDPRADCLVHRRRAGRAGQPPRGRVHLQILESGSSAKRQLDTFARTGDLKAVVDQLVAETAEGVAG